MKHFILLVCISCSFSFSNAIKAEVPRLISVQSSAEKSLEPDMARIQISIWGKGNNAKSAQIQSQKQYEQFKKIIKEFHLASTDVQTTGLELNPDSVYDQKKGTNTIVGYISTQSIRVTFKDAQKVGNFLDQLISDDKNVEKNIKEGISVQSVNWDLQNRVEVEQQLLTEAVAAVETRAQVLARAAHVKIKNLFRLTPQGESGPSLPVMYEMDEAAPMAKKSFGGARHSDTSIFRGEIKLQATVSADYALE